MDRALYVAMSSGQNIMSAQALHAHNLANATTAGFQADLARARTLAVSGAGFDTRAYAISETAGTDFSRGTLMETGRDMDVAVDGEGWIAVLGRDGQEAYTRAGSFKVNVQGQLLTGNNLPVLGNGGPIAIPPFDKITVGSDGTITVQPQGQSVEVLAVVDRIKLVSPNLADLEKSVDGLIRRKDGQPQEADAFVGVRSGFLQASNVSAVDELTEILTLAREFEVNIKMMKTLEENSSAAAQVLRSS